MDEVHLGLAALAAGLEVLVAVAQVGEAVAVLMPSCAQSQSSTTTLSRFIGVAKIELEIGSTKDTVFKHKQLTEVQFAFGVPWTATPDFSRQGWLSPMLKVKNEHRGSRAQTLQHAANELALGVSNVPL